ncbi:hypothetical protein [Candidatus Thioglobus sp.]|uniref:hypothetical protein n=1 Tax=Candidatus Thioglobus sp. TaxID=2026721 RepID=UPI003D0F8305
MNKKILVISFIVAFFTVHPINKLCSETCLSEALLIATVFSLLNVQIYKFFIGKSFYVALLVSPIIKDLSDCKNDTERMSRVFHTIYNVVINTIFVVWAIKVSWIFN